MTEINMTVPDLGDDGGAEVIEILFKVGDTVNVDDIVIVLESDKATMEIPCEQSGILSAISVAIGDQVKSGDLIAKLQTKNESVQQEKSALKSNQADKEDNSKVGSVLTPENKNTQAQPPVKVQAPRLVIETLPDTGSEGGSELIEILCKVGDTIKKDDILFVLESDKATMEFPATYNGEVKRLLVSLGEQLKFGDQLLEVLTADADERAEVNSEIKVESGTNIASQKNESISTAAVSHTQKAPRVQQTVQVSNAYRNVNVHAGPAARRLSRELGVDLGLVKPSGPRERILKDDIKAFVKVNLGKGGGSKANTIFEFEHPTTDFSKFGEIELQKLSRIKKVSAKNLSRAWLTIPHVTQFDEADITELEDFRKNNKNALKEQGVNLTPLAFLVKASALALKEFPRFNASLDNNGEQLILKKYFNIGVAVDTEDGLVVPVIKHADKKSLIDIAKELGEISEKARNKKLMPQDMQGACFSISSLGGIGGTAFTPIVNWPEVAILGVSRSQIKPVYDGKTFVPRLLLPLSLSYDHRVIDGAEAARFSRYFSELLSAASLLSL